ncbi:hypothetical protein AYJ59_07920 [Thiomicrospira sp. S5]|nr:hypothetical protein AYJ59_07920 [Thiomicrospira sp. S5]
MAVFISLSVTKYNSMKTELSRELSADTSLLNHIMQSTLVENELLLDLLGAQLLQNNTYQDLTKTQQLFDKMLSAKPILAGFILASPQGDIMAATSNLNIHDISNLLENDITHDSFQKALKSQKMILGRTYYTPALNTWILPMRKALHDDSGKIIAVITTALKVDETNFLNNFRLEEFRHADIISDLNYYRLLVTGISKSDYDKFYMHPLSNRLLTDLRRKYRELYGLTLEEMKHYSTPFAFDLDSKVFNNNMLGSVVYNQRYDLWVTLFQPIKTLMPEFSRVMMTYSTFFLIAIIITFALFRTIANYEERTRTRLLHQATHDPLTNLPNRYYLDTELKHQLEKNPHHEYSLMFLDLDNFKNINDNFGHETGDTVLTEVSKRFKALLHKTDSVIRFGGDEFVIIVHSTSNDVSTLAHSFIKSLSLPFHIDDMRFNLGMSIGIAQYPQDGDTLKTILSRADMAMYHAKKHKNAVAFFSETMRQNTLHKVHLEHKLRQAIKYNEIYVVYQPQLDRNQKLHGVEALARWKNTTFGEISPAEFIPIAEEIGYMPELGHYILDTALRRMAEFQKNHNVRFRLSLNVSARQFMSHRFYHDLTDAIEKNGYPADLLTIEVTESLFIEDFEYVHDLLIRLQRRGIWLSLDDFGTGFSSLSLLRKLPFDELKIDKSFIDNVLNKQSDHGLVESIIEIGQKLNMRTLAEGVETLEQLQQLCDYGCELFQGYHFSKPLKYKQLEEFISSHS